MLKIRAILGALLLLSVLPDAALPALATTPAAKGAQIEAELRSDLDCPASTPVRQRRPVEEERVNGSSSPVKERRWDNNPSG